MAEAIPTRIKKMSRGEANAKTLGGEKIKKKEDGRQVQEQDRQEEDGREKANAKTLGGEKMEGKFKNKINKKKMEEERQM